MPLRGSANFYIMIFIHTKIPPLVLYFIIYNLYNIFFLINKDINILDIFIIFMPQVFIERYIFNLYAASWLRKFI